MTVPTQHPFAPGADGIAPDLERKQNQRLMIASSVSVAVNLMFLIGAALGMEERAVPETPERPMTGVIQIIPQSTPTPVAKPTPSPIARVEPKTKPEPQQTPPPGPLKEAVIVRPDEPTPRVLVQPTPPPVPDVPEISEVEPVPTPIKPVEEPVATTAVEEAQSASSAVRVRETTASNRMTGASLATNVASAAPTLRGGVSTASDPGVVAPSLTSGTSTLSLGIRTPRASAVESVAGGTVTDSEDRLTVPGPARRQSVNAPSPRTGGEGVSMSTGVSGSVGVPRGDRGSASSGSDVLARPTTAGGAVGGGAAPGADTARSPERDSGIRAGSGADATKDFGIKGGTGKATEWDPKGTGSAESVGRAAITVVAGGGGGKNIVSTKARFRDGNSETIQVTSGKDPRTIRFVPAPKITSLPRQIGNPNIDAIVNAKLLARKQPETTEAMRETRLNPVTVEFTINANGSATYRIVRSSGNPDVDAAVLKACAGYRWQPGSRGGEPVTSRQRVTFDPNE
jgi:TonB family protein